MRLAYVTETWPPEVNGVAMTVERTVRHLRRSGHAVLLIRPRQAGEWHMDGRAEWRTAGAPIPMYPDLRLGLARVGAIETRLDGFDADLVHVATPGPLGRAAIAAARRLGIPATTDFRTRFDRYCDHYHFGFARPLVGAYLRGLSRHCAATFVPCRAMRRDLQQRGFPRVEICARGVDAARFAPARRDAGLRERWGAAPDAPVLLTVSRLAAEKNVPLALRAFEALRRSRPETRCVVVGDGPLRAALAARHRDVHFAGVLRGEALAAHYASADVFLFPSLSETFGNVTLEALASGLAVVAFDDAAAGEWIRDGHNGHTVAAGDDAAFIAAVQRAAADGAAGSTLRERARRTSLGADWEAVLGAFERRLVELASYTADPLPDATLA